jgi:hypothetical protein
MSDKVKKNYVNPAWAAWSHADKSRGHVSIVISKGKRRVAVSKSVVTMPSAKIRRLGGLKSKIVCKRNGCGKRISKLAEFHNDPYCSRVCMAKDKRLKIVSTKELFSKNFGRKVLPK